MSPVPWTHNSCRGRKENLSVFRNILPRKYRTKQDTVMEVPQRQFSVMKCIFIYTSTCRQIFTHHNTMQMWMQHKNYPEKSTKRIILRT